MIRVLQPDEVRTTWWRKKGWTGRRVEQNKTILRMSPKLENCSKS